MSNVSLELTFSVSFFFRRAHCGFLWSRVCDLVLGDIYSHIIRSGEGWNASLVELTDVAKAFNISFYDVFLKKMSYYDFSPIVFDRFKFYLTNRFLTVRIVKTVSNSSLLKRGFLQGFRPIYNYILCGKLLLHIRSRENRLHVVCCVEDFTFIRPSYFYCYTITFASSLLFAAQHCVFI